MERTPQEERRALQVRGRPPRRCSAVKHRRLFWLAVCSPADPSAPPGLLTHLSLLDNSEARPLSGADGRSLPGSWSR